MIYGLSYGYIEYFSYPIAALYDAFFAKNTLILVDEYSF